MPGVSKKCERASNPLTVPKTSAPPIQALAALPNLGPASALMLVEAGIDRIECLEDLGAVAAYWQVKQHRQSHGLGCSLNLLWALAGALENCHWTQIKRHQGGDLLLAVDALAAQEQANNPTT